MNSGRDTESSEQLTELFDVQNNQDKIKLDTQDKVFVASPSVGMFACEEG